MSYDDYFDRKPVIVTAALTGGVHGKKANPNLPETPEESGQAAAAVEEVGVSVVTDHRRVRNR